MGLTSFTFSNKANSRLGTFLSGSYLNGFKSDTFVALISTLGIGALNFARTGTATYTDSTGTLQTAATGVPRTDHHIWDGSAWVNQGLLLESDAATNLLTYSEQFDNAAWNKIVGLVNANTTTAPDGTLTADRFIDSNSGVTEFSQIHYSVAAIPSGTSTFSLYAKADGLNYVCLRTNNFDASSAGLSFFNLSNGTVSKESANHSNLNITDVGNGWYRCSISFTTTTDLAGTLVLQMSENGSSASVNSDGTSSIYIWGAQLEANSTPTSYIKTEATTATRNAETLTASAGDLPEIPTHDVTNLLTYSEQFDNAAWTKQQATVSADAVAAPDGTTTADKIVATTDAGTHSVRLNVSFIDGLGLYTVSAYFKEAEYRYAWIVDTAFSRYKVGFDLQGLTVTQGTGTAVIGFVSASIEDVGNGWRRCSAVLERLTTDSAGLGLSGAEVGTAGTVNGPNFTGDGTSGIYLWGAQLETGSDASAYVKTEATSVTATLPASNASYSIQMEGTISYADEDTGAQIRPLTWTNGSETIQIYISTSGTRTGQPTFRQSDGVTTQIVQAPIDTYTPGINVPFNIASRHGSAFINGAVDGTALTANTTPTALPDLTATDLQIAPKFNGTIKLLRIWGADIGDTGIAAASA